MEHNFLNKNIIIHPWDFEDGDTRAWEQQRFDLQHNKGLLKFGASEVAQVVGKGYESAFKLFQVKLGKITPKKVNLLMIHGNNCEDIIMDYSKAYSVEDPSEEVTAQNYLDKNFQRQIDKAKYFIECPDYPAILCSLDGVLFKGEQEFDGNIAKFDIPVEYKNVSFTSFSRWEGNIPEYYYIQCQTQLAFTGAPYMWFIALVDNRELWIRKVEASQEWFTFINDETIDLSLRISKAKVIQAEIDSTSDPQLREKLETLFWELEPVVTDDDEDTKALREAYNQDDSVIIGDEQDLEYALNYLNEHEAETEAKKGKTLNKNLLLQRMKGASKMEVVNDGYIITVLGGLRFSVKRKEIK